MESIGREREGKMMVRDRQRYERQEGKEKREEKNIAVGAGGVKI